MLLGKSYNTLDAQRRVTIPKHLRLEFGTNGVLTRGLDGGLFLFPVSYWERFLTNLRQQPFTQKRSRDFWRLLVNDAYEVEPDALGRVTVSEHLSDLGGFDKNVVVVGSLEYIEIWDRDRYHAYLDGLGDQAEEIAESLVWKESDAHSSTLL